VSDDKDIERKISNMFVRCNILTGKFYVSIRSDVDTTPFILPLFYDIAL